MQQHFPPLILASGSPRRKALLAALGVDFTVQSGNAHEPDTGATPEDIVTKNACIKRDAVAAQLNSEAVVIAADTLVFYKEHVLAKPADRVDAVRMLRMLSGATHTVVTGLALLNTVNGKKIEGYEKTDVTFRDLSDEEIGRFVDIVNPLDRAGAYTVDGPGTLLVAKYSGCYQNVLGLPIVKLDELLREIGVNIFERMVADNTFFL